MKPLLPVCFLHRFLFFFYPGSVTLSSSTSPHPLFSSPPAALHLSAEHRYLFRNLSVEIILHLRRSLSTHNYHGQSCRTVLNSAGTPTLMTLLTARPSSCRKSPAPHLPYISPHFFFRLSISPRLCIQKNKAFCLIL